MASGGLHQTGLQNKWFAPIENELLSKPQSNSVDVRRQLISAAKIVDNFVFSKN
jgi:hypothetical protein